jgi:uncharacterized protein GlcG (DUF336 family)
MRFLRRLEIKGDVMNKVFFSAAVACCAWVGVAAPAGAQEMRPALTAASAKAIVAGCEAYALEKGWALNIAVLDQGRNMIAFLRMDGSLLGSLEISRWKANASASFQGPTKTAAERAKEFPAFAAAPNMAIFEGGEAIFTTDGAHLGGVGVSGAAGAEDAECARAGIAKAGLRHDRPE